VRYKAKNSLHIQLSSLSNMPCTYRKYVDCTFFKLCCRLFCLFLHIYYVAPARRRLLPGFSCLLTWLLLSPVFNCFSWCCQRVNYLKKTFFLVFEGKSVDVIFSCVFASWSGCIFVIVWYKIFVLTKERFKKKLIYVEQLAVLFLFLFDLVYALQW